MSQIALPFDWPADMADEPFIIGAGNADAVRHLDRLSLWPVRATLIVGPRKSGRSLLARIFASKYGGAIVDDVEGREEEAVFHAWNRAQETRAPLLIVADAPPPEWRIALPDLRSRIAATPVVRIGPPDEDLVRALVEKLLARRGLVLPAEVAQWLPPRIERSHVAALRIVEVLDAEMLARQHRLTIPLARRALEAASLIARSD